MAVLALFASAAYAQDLRVGVGQTKSINGLKIKFNRVVEDSRCPVGTECIWAGNARISITVAARRQKPRTVELNTNAGDKSVTIGRRVIELVSVSPERRAGATVPSRSYQVLLRVEAISSEKAK